MNLSEFNTNPVCFGYTVTAPVSQPYAVIQFIVFILASLAMVVSGAFYIWRRRNRRRLQNHSLVPVLFGSFGGAIWILTRSYYNFVGKEYMACQGFMFLFYMALPLTRAADWFDMVNYLTRLSQRQKQTALTVSAIQMERKEQTSMEHLGPASPKQWLIGLYNQMLVLTDFYFFQNEYFQQYHVQLSGKEKFRAVSKFRRASYDMCMVLLFSLVFFTVYLIRALTDPVYINCTGCGLMWGDWLISFAMLVFTFPSQALFLYRHRDMPDVLGVRREFMYTLAAVNPFNFTFGILAMVDPGGVMQEQKFDWFTGEAMMIFMAHYFRCIRTLQITARTQRWGETHVTLFDVLSDSHASLLFEKYLISELANENLIFWREATAFKRGYGTRDFDMSQELGKILYRSFIGQHAHMPINISQELAETIKQGCRGVISRNIFDAALVEVFNLLSRGPFLRFVKTPEFREYSRNVFDYTLAQELEVAGAQVRDSHHPSMDGTPHRDITNNNADKRIMDVETYVRLL